MRKPGILSAAVGLSLGLSLNAQADGNAPERLFLQQLTSDSVVVKWRGGTGTEVCVSRSMGTFKKSSKAKGKGNAAPLTCVEGVNDGSHLEATLTGLAPATHYFYTVGDSIDASQQFSTAPAAGELPADGNTHILIVGDSGTITDGISDDHPEGEYPGEAQAVLDGYFTYASNNGNEPVDLFLALGDNAYESGTDDEWQKSFFELYTDILNTAQVLPTIGNHEMGVGALWLPRAVVCGLAGFPPTDCPLPPLDPFPYPAGGVSTSSDPDSYSTTNGLVPDGTGMPYLDIFSLPAGGESGGVASGTEQYYSVDYGNVHVVSLDTQLTARDDTARNAMKDWLISDLSANTLDWTIVIFHHPPYTKGTNHDSDDAGTGLLGDVDKPEVDMREQFTPVLEAHGVDVVYSGHSHSYERSYYLKGHTGTSDTFDAALHAELVDGHPASGRAADGETYHQLSPTSGNVDDRVVYTVAGSSGKANKGGDSFGITLDTEWLRHDAHIEQPLSNTKCDYPEGCREGMRGLGVKGSVVIDASSDSLRARFVDVNGDVLDEFVINR